MGFMIYPRLTNRPVRVCVIGAGGTGSQVLTGLAQLNMAMLALGHPGGLDVEVWDDDHVSEANVGRQMFFPADVGLPKATVMVNRINMTLGTAWKATVKRFCPSQAFTADLVVGCVDNRASRKSILETLQESHGTKLWLDIGNNLDSGQVVLGEVQSKHSKEAKTLPHAAELFPEIVDDSLDAEDDVPSCSLAESLEKQALFVNRGVALYALNILWQLFRYGEIDHHGVFVNLKTGRSNPIPIDKETWARMGYSPKVKRSRKQKVASPAQQAA